MTAGEVKKAWRRSLSRALKERGFTHPEEDIYRRTTSTGFEGVLLRLRAYGRGETAVSILSMGPQVVLTDVEEATAALTGEPRNPYASTWVEPMADVLEAAGSYSYDQERVARGLYILDSVEKIPAGTTAVLDVLDTFAEPWFAALRDPHILLQRRLGSGVSRLPEPAVKTAILAHQLGDTATVRRLVESCDQRRANPVGGTEERYRIARDKIATLLA